MCVCVCVCGCECVCLCVCVSVCEYVRVVNNRNTGIGFVLHVIFFLQYNDFKKDLSVDFSFTIIIDRPVVVFFSFPTYNFNHN